MVESVNPSEPTTVTIGSTKDLPAAPTGIKAKADGAGVMLTWKANASKDKIKQYNVYFSDKEKGTFKKLGSVE